MRRTPLTPLRVARQKHSRPMPFGLTAPIPVMTTRRMDLLCLFSGRRYRLNLMNASMERRPASALAVFLAGLQAGTIAVLWMLAWMGVSAMWQRRSFWSAVNLMASILAGNSAIRNGFASSTWSGLALYLLIYSLLGAAFAVLVRDRFTGLGTLLIAIFF